MRQETSRCSWTMIRCFAFYDHYMFSEGGSSSSPVFHTYSTSSYNYFFPLHVFTVNRFAFHSVQNICGRLRGCAPALRDDGLCRICPAVQTDTVKLCVFVQPAERWHAAVGLDCHLRASACHPFILGEIAPRALGAAV